MRFVCLCLFLAACGAADPTASWVVGSGPLAVVTGRAHVFGPRNALTLDGATVSAAESPQHRATVAADGSFSLEVPSGKPVSFLVEQPGFPKNQSAAIPVDAQGIAMLGFQVPTEDTYGSLAALAGIKPDPARCQVATTVSRKGTAPYGGPASASPTSSCTSTRPRARPPSTSPTPATPSSTPTPTSRRRASTAA